MQSQSPHPSLRLGVSKKRRGRARLLVGIVLAIGICLLLALPFLLRLELGNPAETSPAVPPNPHPASSPIPPNPAPPVPILDTLNPTVFHQQTLAVIHTQQAQDAVLAATHARQQELDATTQKH